MPELRKGFHEDLDAIRDDIVRLGAMVTETIPKGTDVLLSGNLGAAKTLIEYDDVIDSLSLKIEDDCYHLLALQQPMAGDLRMIITSIRLSSEIERSADLVTNIAKAARRIYGTELNPQIRGRIERMGEEARKLFTRAMDAYVDADADLGAALDDMDDRMDELHADFIQDIFTAHADGQLDLQAAVQLAVVGRFFERIGDHAVNIGERVQFMVTGWLPEHTGAARVEARERVAHSSDAAGDSGATSPAANGDATAPADAAAPGGDVT